MRQLIIAALLLAAGTARAVEYELPIEIETEEDLYELFYSQEISEQTYDTLIELLRRGVDLSTADAEELYTLPGLTTADVDAIIAYREQAGGIADPAALVAAGVLSADKLATIDAYLVVSRPEGPGAFTATGRVRYRTLYTAADGRLPPMALEGKVSTLRRLTLAVDLLLTRNQLGGLRWDSTREALSAEPRATRFAVPKAYAMWRAPDFEAIAGSYTAGFGQRLTFDETPLYTPNGIYPDAVLKRQTDLVRDCIESTGELPASPCPSDYRKYVTPDFDWRQALFGLALSARKLSAGPGWLQLTGFGSAQLRDIYQYELYDRSICADPADDKDPDCGAPLVFRRGADPADPESRFSFQTLPGMWWELLGGGNLSWFAGRRTHVGVTGYGARPSWTVGGATLDFQEWSRFPRGGPYGAIGIDAAWGQSWADLGVEVARSFDGVTGGDLGVLARGTATWPKNELELSLRWYGRNFANPHTGAIAEPDKLDGQRARDETGVRLRYGGRASRRLALRGLADFWVLPSTSTPKVRVEVRGDYTFTRQVTAGAYLRWADRDLREGGHGQCYDVRIEFEDENGEPVQCKGQGFDLGALVKLMLQKRMELKLQAQTRVADDFGYPDHFRYDLYGWTTFNWWMTDNARLRARVYYSRPDLQGDVSQKTFYYYVEELRASVQLTYRLPRSFTVNGRYELRAYLNDEKRSYVRDPSPEHWLGVELEARF